MNEVGNFVKSVLPRLTSRPAQNALKSLGISLTDDNGNLRDVITVYEEVAKKVQNITDAERVAVTEGLAGKYHISRMQALLDDLASADSMYKSMYETSKNSDGSAMRENEKYMKSLEARISLMKVEFEKLAIAIGNAFLTDGMISFMQVASSTLSLFSAIVEDIGALPVVLATASSALVLFSTRFRNLAQAIITKTTALTASNVATNKSTITEGRYTLVAAKSDVVNRKLTLSTTALASARAKHNATTSASIVANQLATASAQKQATANAVLASSFRALGTATIVGAAFVALGFALEKVISVIGEARRKSEELATTNKELVNSYQNNAEDIDKLTAKLKSLNTQLGDNPDPTSDKYKEYLETQNELASLMPSIIKGEDEYGNKIVDNTLVIEAKVKALQSQLELQKKVNEEEAKVKQDEDVEVASDDIDKAKKDLDKAYKNYWLDSDLNRGNLDKETLKNLGFEDDLKKLNSLKDMYEALNRVNKEINEAPRTEFNTNKFMNLENLKTRLEEGIKIAEGASNTINSALFTIRSAAMDTASEYTSEFKNMTTSSKELAEGVLVSAIGFLDSKEAIDSFNDSVASMNGNENLKAEFTELQGVIEEIAKTDIVDPKEFENKYKEALTSSRDAILAESGFKKSSDEYKALEDTLNNLISKNYEHIHAVLEKAKAEGLSVEETQALVMATMDGTTVMEESSDAVETLTDKLNDYKSALEQLVGISSSGIDATDELIFTYQTLMRQAELLGGVTNLTAEQQLLLEAAIQELTNAYPHLVENGELRIENIIKENEANKILLEVIEMSKDGKLDAEQEMTLASTLNTKERIDNILKEIEALEIYRQALKEVMEETTKAIDNADTNGSSELDTLRQEMRFYRAEEGYNSSNSSLEAKKDELGNLRDELDLGIGTIEEYTKEEEKSKNATDKSTKSTDALKDSTDAYKLSLEKLNLELERMQAIQAKFPEYSEEYQSALESEIALQEQKLELMKSQEGSLKSMTSLSSSGVGSLANSASSLSGTNTEQQIWNFFKSKGLSESATAGIMGNLRQESNLNSSSVASNGASGIAQWMGGRLTNLKNYASSIGKSWDDLSAQLEFLWHELNGGEATTKSILNKNGGISAFNNMSVKDASELFEKAFERSGGSAQSKRNAYAEEFFRKLSTGTDTVQEFSNSLTTTAKTINGFSGKITSTYKDPNRSDNHRGIDIAGNKGDRIDATTRGKVIASGDATSQGYDWSYGNLVVVQDDAGLKHIYAHLSKAIAKVGDTIEAGTQVGEMGSTGNSSGNHLHYEVNLNGQPVDPTEYVTNAKNGLASVGSSINDVESELVSVQSSIIQQETLIAELQRKLLDAELSVYGRRNEILDADLSKQDARLANVNVDSEEYNKILEYQTLLLQKKQKANQEELAYINDLIANGGLSATALADMKDRTVELTTEMYALDQQLQNTAFEKLDLYNEKREAPQDNIEFIKSQMAMMDDDTEEYADSLNKIILSLQEIQGFNISQLADLENEIKSGKFTGEALENLQDQYEDLKVTIQETNGEIQDAFYQQSEYVFRINDNAIDKTQDKLDFLDYQLGLLGDSDTDVKVKVSLYGEMKLGLNESIAQIDQGIQTVLAERELAISRGVQNLDEYDVKFESYIEQRRNQNSKLQSIYNDMQSIVENALSKVKDAESNAYSEASKVIDKALSESEARISKFSDTIDNLGRKLEVLDESDFNEKMSITSQQLSNTRSMASQIIAEYDRVASTPIYNEEQKAQVESQLKNLKSQLADANSQIIQYTKNLEQTHFESLIYGANKASKEIDRLTGKLNRNLELIEGGLLSGTDIDLSLDSFVGKTLDLSTLISDPLAERDTILQIQDIRSSSYGEQIREAEAFYEEMKAKAEEFQKVMLEEVKKFEENMLKLLEIQNEKKKKEEEKANKDKESTTKDVNSNELKTLEQHYKNLQSTMTTAMKMYQQEYSSIWGDIVDDLKRQIAEIESLISNVNMTIPQVDGVDGNSPSIESVPKYANGTGKDSHVGGLAITNEKGRELVILPNGDIKLTSSSNAHVDKLMDLPKGTHVIPNKETNQILDNLPSYANGTNFDINKLNTGKLFSNKNYYNDFADFIRELQKNTDVMKQLSDTDKTAITDLSNLMSLYVDENYKDSKEEIKNLIESISNEIKSPIRDSIKSAEEERKNAERADETVKDGYWELLDGGKFKRNSDKEMLDAVKSYDRVEDYFLNNFKEHIETGRRKDFLGDYFLHNYVNPLKELGYWTEEELKKIEALSKNYRILEFDNTTMWQDVNPENIVKSDSEIFDKLQNELDNLSATIDENGALKYTDTTVAGKTIKGDYISWYDFDDWITKNGFGNFQFTLDEDGKIYSTGLSSKGKQPTTSNPNSPDSPSGDNSGSKPNKTISYSKEYLDRWTAHQANRELAQKEIDELQLQLDELIDNDGTEAEIKNLQDEILSKVEAKNFEDSKMILDGIVDLEKQRMNVLLENRKTIVDELNKALKDGSLTEEGVQRLKDRISELDDQIGSTQTNLKNIAQQRFELERSARDKILNSIQKETDEAEFLLEITRSISPFDYSKSIPIMQDLYNNAVKYTSELQTQLELIKEQMKEFEVGSYEWNQLNNQVKEYNQQIQQSLLNQQRQRKQLFEEQMKAQLRQIEIQIFGGKTEEQARKELERKYKLQDMYVEGLERELEVDKIIAYARSNSIQLTKEELALLNSKDKIEKKALERLQKQLEIRELEQRLLNLNMEKNIQQLTKQADGTWDYTYVVDQNAIDEAEQQLREKKLELIEFDQDVERQKEQDDLDAKSEFYNEVKDIVDDALNGEITSFQQFSQRMNALNTTFLNGMSETTKIQWQSMFETVNTNVQGMLTIYQNYVAQLQALAAQAEAALARMMAAQSKQSSIEASSTKSASSTSTSNYQQFASGGYTGNDEGLAMLHEKEIILNKDDTSNFLKVIDITRNVIGKLNLFNPNSIAKNLIKPNSTTEQIFNIEKLEFPSVTNSDEIENAIKNLPSIAMSKVRLNY